MLRSIFFSSKSHLPSENLRVMMIHFFFLFTMIVEHKKDTIQPHSRMCKIATPIFSIVIILQHSDKSILKSKIWFHCVWFVHKISWISYHTCWEIFFSSKIPFLNVVSPLKKKVYAVIISNSKRGVNLLVGE